MKFKWFATMAIMALAAMALAQSSEGEVVEAFSERLPGTFDRQAYEENMQFTFDWLTSEHVSGADRFAISGLPSEGDLADLESEYNNNGVRKLVRVGASIEVNQAVDFRNLNPNRLARGDVRVGNGLARGANDGGIVWTGLVTSPGASARAFSHASRNGSCGVSCAKAATATNTPKISARMP